MDGGKKTSKLQQEKKGKKSRCKRAANLKKTKVPVEVTIRFPSPCYYPLSCVSSCSYPIVFSLLAIRVFTR